MLSGLNSIIRNILWVRRIPSFYFFAEANIKGPSMAPLSLSELVIVKCEDFNRQFVDGVGIIHTFLFLKRKINKALIDSCRAEYLLVSYGLSMMLGASLLGVGTDETSLQAGQLVCESPIPYPT
jgi:hypothetical protein